MSAWALTNIDSGNICNAKFHVSEARHSEDEDFNIFVFFFGSNPGLQLLAMAAIFVHQSKTILAALVEGHLSYIPIKFE